MIASGQVRKSSAKKPSTFVHGNAAGSGQLGLTESGLTLTPAPSLHCAGHLSGHLLKLQAT